MTIEELAATLGEAQRERTPLTIVGGNTLRGMGRPGAPDARVLSTRALAEVIEDAPADLTIAVQGGMSLRALAQRLGAHGTQIPFDAPFAGEATVGGTLAAGWLGPRRHLYGRPRDFVIGSTIALADGSIARAGGMVVKNVSGYDMSRLYVGSFGTLGVLARVNLKTIAAPERTRLFTMRLPEYTRTRAIAALATMRIVPAAVLWVEGFKQQIDGEDGAEGRLLAFVECSDAMLERATRELRSALGRAGVPETRVVDAGAREAFERVLDAYVANVGERSITYRIGGFPDEAEATALEALALAQRFELRSDTLLDAMNGDVIVRVSDLDARALGAKIEMFDDALHDLRPQAIVVAGEHPSRALLQVWGAPPDALARMRALKERFDPHGILNPGRFVGGL